MKKIIIVILVILVIIIGGIDMFNHQKEKDISDLNNEEEIVLNRYKAILKARVTLTANAYGAEGSWPFNVSAYFERINGDWLYINKD